MKVFKFLAMMIAMLAMSVSFSSCGDDSDEPVPSDAVVSTYSGSVENMYWGKSGQGYVTFTRASDTTVFLTLFKSEALGINVTGNYEINVASIGNRTYQLSSATSYQIKGSVNDKSLNLTVVVDDETLVFNGTR